VDLGELQVFLMVAKEGSFSRAAERLYRTQPPLAWVFANWKIRWASPCLCAARARTPDRRGRAPERLRRAPAEPPRRGKKGPERVGGSETRGAVPGRERKLHPCLASGPLQISRNAPGGSGARSSHVFANIPHEVLNYRLDVGAISYVPRDAQLQATEILKDELTLVVPLKHPLAKRREVDVEDLCQ